MITWPRAYAQIQPLHGQPGLASKDTNKDQTYFLSRLPRSALEKIIFPIGAYEKPEIRRLAESFSLVNAAKKDSTGICFVGERRFSEFIKEHLLDKPGEILDTEGRVLGQHRGLFYYTSGQRKGLAIGGRRDSSELPWFVLAKDVALNRLIVGQGAQHPGRQRRLQRNMFIGLQSRGALCHLRAQARIHTGNPFKMQIRIDGDRLKLFLISHKERLHPTKYAIYHENFCIASAIIEA